MSKKDIVMIVDAQGGGLGKQLITLIKKEMPGLPIIAVGTNSIATTTMLRAGADEAATGENAVKVVAGRAALIIGPIGMIIADAMLGEVTPAMACAIAQADAKRILIPFSNCDNYIAGVSEMTTGELIADALVRMKKYLTQSE